jgi:hypothetical protein
VVRAYPPTTVFPLLSFLPQRCCYADKNVKKFPQESKPATYVFFEKCPVVQPSSRFKLAVLVGRAIANWLFEWFDGKVFDRMLPRTISERKILVQESEPWARQFIWLRWVFTHNSVEHTVVYTGDAPWIDERPTSETRFSECAHIEENALHLKLWAWWSMQFHGWPG